MSAENKKSVAELEKQLQAANTRITELEKEKTELKTAYDLSVQQEAALEAEKKALEASLLKAKRTGVASIPVEGNFRIEVEDPNNAKKKTQKTFRFKNGRTKVVIDNGQKASSTCVLKLANGEKLNEKELTENPVLQGFTQERAEQLMLKYISMQAGFLEEVQ